MTAQIFGTGLKGEVAAHIMRPEKQRGCPGIINNRRDIVFFRHRRDGRHILNLKALRSRGLQENRAGVAFYQRFNVTADHRVVIGDGDPHFFQQTTAEIAGRTINTVRHQQVIAAFQCGQQRQHNGAQPGW